MFRITDFFLSGRFLTSLIFLVPFSYSLPFFVSPLLILHFCFLISNSSFMFIYFKIVIHFFCIMSQNSQIEIFSLKDKDKIFYNPKYCFFIAPIYHDIGLNNAYCFAIHWSKIVIITLSPGLNIFGSNSSRWTRNHS
jgi:hypothetical protein